MNEPMPSRSQMERGLAEIRVRRRLFWFLAIAFLVVFMIFSVWALAEGRWHRVWKSYVVALIGSSVVMNLAWGRVVLSRCPRCGKLFYSTKGLRTFAWRSVFGGKCVHCDLKLGRARHDPDQLNGW